MNNRRVIFLTLIVFGTWSAVACARGPSSGASTQSTDARQYSNLQGNPSKGRTAFIGTCAACHGQDGKGLPGLGKDLTQSEFAKKLSGAELILFIAQGRPAGDALNTTKVDMPPRGGNPALKDQDLADIVAFLRTLK